MSAIKYLAHLLIAVVALVLAAAATSADAQRVSVTDRADYASSQPLMRGLAPSAHGEELA
jgi:hypothetical protein